MKKLLTLALTLQIIIPVLGQDVEHVLDRFKKKAFKFTGDISVNQVLYGAWGDLDMRRNPPAGADMLSGSVVIRHSGFYDFDKNASMKFLYDNEMEWGGFYGQVRWDASWFKV